MVSWKIVPTGPVCRTQKSRTRKPEVAQIHDIGFQGHKLMGSGHKEEAESIFYFSFLVKLISTK